jgi:excisionase family DNA binding protein
MLLTTEAVAKQLSIRPKTVCEWIKRGKLRGVRLGKQWRVDASDLAVFIAKRKT